MDKAVDSNKPFDLETRDRAYEHGWAQDIFTREDTPDRVATKLAQKFLPMIEQAIEARGVSPLFAVEIEAGVGGHGEVDDIVERMKEDLIYGGRL